MKHIGMILGLIGMVMCCMGVVIIAHENVDLRIKNAALVKTIQDNDKTIGGYNKKLDAIHTDLKLVTDQCNVAVHMLKEALEVK